MSIDFGDLEYYLGLVARTVENINSHITHSKSDGLIHEPDHLEKTLNKINMAGEALSLLAGFFHRSLQPQQTPPIVLPPLDPTQVPSKL